MKKEKHFDIIRRPLLTEKSTMSADVEKQTYLFEVEMKTTKKDIKDAVESVFDVKVDSVNTVIVRGKPKRVGKIQGSRSNWKKAYVTLKQGYQINLVEGL
ncbi:MAG TPA: 50S ribosomal protein L23 [bacterium]|nr:50S ribosomal protein L23 [bacterium]